MRVRFEEEDSGASDRKFEFRIWRKSNWAVLGGLHIALKALSTARATHNVKKMELCIMLCDPAIHRFKT